MHNSTFLEEVAQKLYERYGNALSSMRLVLPSRRAGLFFSDALKRIVGKPIWQPCYISMDEIMCEASSLKQGDKFLIIAELYKIYVTYHPDESFDKFYFWGEMLLGDFDLIDKYMIDADMLFRNIVDLKELESDLSYLSDDMRRMIHDFWSNFNIEASLSEEKRKFLSIWMSLAPIYNKLHTRLEELGYAYSGMIYRSAINNISTGSGSPDTSQHYIFIGFNALSECEKRMLKFLNNNAQCDFYWDYDSYYTSQSEQEAGRFLRENISLFKPADEITHDNFLSIKKKISSISCVSNAIQCKYVNNILQEISKQSDFNKDTAIILTNESLLLPLLHSLPENIGEKLNITMGYPLRQTTAYSFVERLIELQKNVRHSNSGTTFYHADVTGILNHPYITEIAEKEAAEIQKTIIAGRLIRVGSEHFAKSEVLQHIFTHTDGYKELSKYLIDTLQLITAHVADDNEDRTLKMAYMTLLSNEIHRLGNVLNNCDIELSTSIYTSLLRRHLQGIKIPYTGEPLQGLQIMGILESRNIDFKNVIILSMNDDNFPGNVGTASSFIPYNLRAAYGLPTPEHHEGVYAYYFYRLIQRAERVDMLYCSHADEKSTGEKSRYIYQLEYESPYTVNRINVGVDVGASTFNDNAIPKRGEVLERLNQYLNGEKRLSPTALSNYIACPMRFYFSAIAKLKTGDELTEEVDNSMFGNILHRAMQLLYADILNDANPSIRLKAMLEDNTIEQTVIQAASSEYLNDAEADIKEYTGNLLLVKDTITRYISHGIIPYDIANSDFVVTGVEKPIKYDFDLGDGREVHMGGIADRIDSLDNGCLRVVDYKSGSPNTEAGSIESLFNGETRNTNRYVLQTMLYSMILHHTENREVKPALYFARNMSNENFSPYIKIKDSQYDEVTYTEHATAFEEQLATKLRELFNPDIPFIRCGADDDKSCEYCDFKTICKR